MKKKAIVGLLVATTLSVVPTPVMAEGLASINFRSNDTVLVGENIKVYLSIENIVNDHNGIVSVGGKLNYDKTELKLIDSKKLDTPYGFWFNPESNKLAGLDFTFENELNKDTAIYEFTFQALKTGTTKITLDEVELGDKKAELLIPSVYGKTIQIVEEKTTANEPISVVEEKVEKNTNNVEALEKKIESLEKTITKLKEEKNSTPKEYMIATKKAERMETQKEKIIKINNKVKEFIKKLSQLF